ncbi:hypothetical protein EYF80_001147 [Liparis tanakae]|uniref:Uncharacterized protein n=1 Tax=Liparis tanakae TaxID=230148 RepID=A0A4Z2JDK6_9TELE|nr:hypothetical protein EYF80_001147 [Liparis tanakae]
MSTDFSCFMRSSMASITMKQPVLPTPALTEGRDGERYFTANCRFTLYNEMHWQYKHLKRRHKHYGLWTTMGPASEGLQAFTLRRKARMGVGYSGTPWSGHAMNWNCLTSLFSLEPFCRRVGGVSDSGSLVIMTMVLDLCSHTILQKSLRVSGSGP